MNILLGIGFRISDREICPFCDEPCSVRPQFLGDEPLKAAIEEDSNQTCGELAKRVQVSEKKHQTSPAPPRGGIQVGTPYIVGNQQAMTSDSLFSMAFLVTQHTHIWSSAH